MRSRLAPIAEAMFRWFLLLLGVIAACETDGNPCAEGRPCDGICTDIMSDSMNCGGCGQTCGGMTKGAAIDVPTVCAEGMCGAVVGVRNRLSCEEFCRIVDYGDRAMACRAVCKFEMQDRFRTASFGIGKAVGDARYGTSDVPTYVSFEHCGDLPALTVGDGRFEELACCCEASF